MSLPTHLAVAMTAKRMVSMMTMYSVPQYLASGSPKQLAILGAGVQARSHFCALSHFFKFQKVCTVKAGYNIKVGVGGKLV